MIFEKQIRLAHTSILVVTVNQEIGEDRSSGSLASGRLLWKIQQSICKICDPEYSFRCAYSNIISFTVIVYNKYILDRKLYGWPFPISLAMIHMTFCSSLAFLLVRVFKVVEPVSFSWNVYLTCILPIGALYSPLCLLLFIPSGSCLKRTLLTTPPRAISVGVAIAAYGEAKYDSWGVFLLLLGVLFEATRLVMIQILLTSKALTMNVAGVVKDWLLIAFSWSVIKDTVTPVNLIGYGLAFLGVAYYNNNKLQAKKSQQADEEARRLLLERDSNDSQA
ncbi:hypothetical protein KY290_022056 [Solanum tuberosum]|uniref:Sugar phosphate transporter domain-containing protein n=2 Tax=Solanum tuberosum TaxID=4113 RepID=A0ABQ7V4D7_SOLTU|nr:hypothetical protein KY289_021205 [Solanum tuberosum]KAH0758563.1 hypothetical protein KY290_022056 [Solanum tuberosum]